MRTIFKCLLLCYILSCQVPFFSPFLEDTSYILFNLQNFNYQSYTYHNITHTPSHYKFLLLVRCIEGPMTWILNTMLMLLKVQGNSRERQICILDIYKTPTICKTCFVSADKHLIPTGKGEHALNTSCVPVICQKIYLHYLIFKFHNKVVEYKQEFPLLRFQI